MKKNHINSNMLAQNLKIGIEINVHKTGHLFIKRDTCSQNGTLFSQRLIRLILDPKISFKPWEIFLSRVYI